jgi:hypothetical protein
VPVILEEDIELSGFYPLLTLPADALQTSQETPLVMQFVWRADRIELLTLSSRMKRRIASVLFVCVFSLIISVDFNSRYSSTTFNRRSINLL